MLKIGLLFKMMEWKRELVEILSKIPKYETVDLTKSSQSQQSCHVVFTDADEKEIQTWTAPKRVLRVVDKEAFGETEIQVPFRANEVIARLELLILTFQLEEVERLSTSYEELTRLWTQDLEVLKDLHGRRVQARKGKLGPIFFASKYLVGSQGGGDFLDVMPSRDRNSLTFVVSSCSSYGISSALLTLLMEAAAKFSSHFQVAPEALLAALREPLMHTLRENDSVSLFLGTLDRRSLEISFVNLGDIAVYHYCKGKFESLPNQAPALRAASKASPKERTYTLSPDSQLLVLSGAKTLLSADKILKGLLKETEGKKNPIQSSQEFLTELFFQIEQNTKLETDCSALWIKVKGDAIRVLKKTG